MEIVLRSYLIWVEEVRWQTARIIAFILLFIPFNAGCFSMKALRLITLLVVLGLVVGCLAPASSGGTLPKAEPGNLPAGSVAEDEPPVAASSDSYIQTETRTPIEYTGTSN